MSRKKKIEYVRDGVDGKNYVRVWKEHRAWAVQVWLNKNVPSGEPDGDWTMPRVFSVEAAVAQAVLNSK